MTRRPLWWLGVLALVAGCGAAPAPPAEPSAPAPASAPASSTAPPSITAGASPDEVACVDQVRTADTVRGIAAALQKGPVLPAGVALFLLDARNRAATSGVGDPALAAAEAELVASIDDLDAQGRTLLPPGGNPAQDRVQLDATRILTAVDRIEQLCRGMGG